MNSTTNFGTIDLLLSQMFANAESELCARTATSRSCELSGLEASSRNLLLRICNDQKHAMTY